MPLLGPAEAPPFRWINRSGRAPMLLACDHASKAIPLSLGDLGLDETARHAHIAWDIGAAEIAERLSERFDAPAILAGYSRLVIDCNRQTHVAGSICALSDGTPVPGNQELDAVERALRIDEIHAPYHGEIAAALDDFARAGRVPLYLAIHSMTDRLADGHVRPWHIGVCWALDKRLSVPVKAALERDPNLHISDNMPYAVQLDEDYSLPQHALRRGLPNLQVELRQDLVAEREAARRWADILGDALEVVLADPGVFRIEHYWP